MAPESTTSNPAYNNPKSEAYYVRTQLEKNIKQSIPPNKLEEVEKHYEFMVKNLKEEFQKLHTSIQSEISSSLLSIPSAKEDPKETASIKRLVEKANNTKQEILELKDKEIEYVISEIQNALD